MLLSNMCSWLRESAVAWCDRFDAGALSAPDAIQTLDDLDVTIRMLDSARAATIKRIDDTVAWKSSGALDAARYVADRCGLSAGEVRRTLDVEDKLASLPATRAALREGQISKKAGQCIADAASINPGAERELLAKASEGLPRLREACVKARAAAEDPDERADAQRKGRRVRQWTDDLGMGAGEWHIRPEDAGAFKEVLKHETNRLFLEHARAQDHEPLEAYAADALVNLVLGRAGRDQVDEGVQPAAKPTPRYNVHVFIDYGLMTGAYGADGARCEIPGVGPVNTDWVRAVLPEALIDFVIANGKDVKTLTTPARRFTKAMQTVFLVQGRECIVAGCNTRDHLELDHRHEVREGGPTCVANGQPLCPPHHDLKTAGWYLGPPDAITGKCTLRPPP
jgi:hypothetical protein